jgi:hypothetical protein
MFQKLEEIYEKGFVTYQETTFDRLKRQFFTDVNYDKFQETKRKYNSVGSSLLRLQNYFAELESDPDFNSEGIEFTVHELFEIAQSGSIFRNAMLTSVLIEEGVIKREVRVKNASGEVTVYETYMDVPDTVSEESISLRYIVLI